MAGVGLAISRSRSGAAASSNQFSDSRSSRSFRLPVAARSRRTSSTAHASTYRSSRSASSSVRATTRSVSLMCNSRARCRATQSHCRHAWRQNSRGRPVLPGAGSTRRHQRQRASRSPDSDDSGGSFVMTKHYRVSRWRVMDGQLAHPSRQRSISCASALHAASAPSSRSVALSRSSSAAAATRTFSKARVPT